MQELDRRTLRALCRQTEPQSQAELASTLDVSASTLAKSLVRLHNAGFIELPTFGRNKPPKLSVSAALDRLSAEIFKLVGATA